MKQQTFGSGAFGTPWKWCKDMTLQKPVVVLLVPGLMKRRDWRIVTIYEYVWYTLLQKTPLIYNMCINWYIYIYIHSNQLFKHHCHHCRHQPPALDIHNSRRGGRVSSDSQWGLPEVWERSSSWSRYQPRMQCGLWSHGTSLDDVFFCKDSFGWFWWVCWGR